MAAQSFLAAKNCVIIPVLKRNDMLQTVEAEVDVNGTVKLLEPLMVTKKTRAIITLLEETNGKEKNKGNVRQIIELLNSAEFANRKSYSAEEIEAQIDEMRNSWE